ncbi:hypothetical protein BJ944DRAFT_70730 [Cunninghamella echinulata]|nr:hypothetical protein BJ944DRAFT_70730 [Cunninghamella echinulata]
MALLNQVISIHLGKRMQIRVLGVPQTGAKSRVETQIKLCLQLVTDDGDKVQRWSHLKLPEHMVAKDKLKRQQQVTVNTDEHGSITSVSGLDHTNGTIKADKMLFLSARVICASDPTRKVVTCLGCIQRERKRSQRRKENKVKTENDDDKRVEDDQSLALEEQKVLLFNCSEMVDFSSGDTILPTRITCYCRHHNERVGFCIYFEMRDNTGKQVATGMSPPIMITDDHKSSKIKAGRKRPRTDLDKNSVNTQAIISYPFNINVATNNNNSNNNTNNSHTNSPTIITSSNSSLTNSPSFLPFTNYADTPFPNNHNNNQQQPHHHHPSRASSPLNSASMINHMQHNNNNDKKNNIQLNQNILNSLATVAAASSSSSTPPHPSSHQHINNSNNAHNDKTHLTQEKSMIVDRPQMQRMIPNEGPMDGGIEVTILGQGFRPGLTCMFGDTEATNTHYWSPNTLVCILPPATEPGAVVVSFKEYPVVPDSQDLTLFTYCNENDRALMELALQVVGLKMTGKVEDARDIAMRIVEGNENSNQVVATNNSSNAHRQQQQQPSSSRSLSSQLQQHSIRSFSSIESIKQFLDDKTYQHKLNFDWRFMPILDSHGSWTSE